MLQEGGAGRYVLDLRSNPGGLVKAGVDVASLWLDGQRPVFSVRARPGGRPPAHDVSSTMIYKIQLV